jgi:ubiquinone/menaquinone biosynthesis C-methylase UbiE
MEASPFVIVLVVALVLAALGWLLWWLLITTEGVYLGRRVVVALYDLYASRYERIKQYHPEWERETLGEAIIGALDGLPHPLVLDVATGTGRLPAALLSTGAFTGHVIGVDASRKMLHAAVTDKFPAYPTARSHVTLLWRDAEALPFDDETFDAVCCLEALEFMARPQRVLAELVRVAKPGALVTLTNRKGWQARLMPFKTQPTRKFTRYLREALGLEDVSSTLWQMDYDLIWAFKPGLLSVATTAPDPLSALRCPQGHYAFRRVHSPDPLTLRCAECAATLTTGEDGVIEYPHYR